MRTLPIVGQERPNIVSRKSQLVSGTQACEISYFLDRQDAILYAQRLSST